MKYADLVKYKNGSMLIKERAVSVPRNGSNPQQCGISIRQSTEKSQQVIAQMTGENLLQMIVDDGGGGLWIPYLAGASTFGYLDHGQSWAASGPFSGCYFEVGQLNGRLYAAHISCESKDDENVKTWHSTGVMSGKKVLFSKKMSMASVLPSGTVHAACIVFASVVGGNVEVTRVDVQTSSYGGMSGSIFDVQQVTSDAIA